MTDQHEPPPPPENTPDKNPPLAENRAVFSKKIAEKWLEGIMSKEYSITVHPKTSIFSQRLMRSLQEQGWDCSLVDEKLVITSDDPFKLANLINTLKKYGLFVEN